MNKDELAACYDELLLSLMDTRLSSESQNKVVGMIQEQLTRLRENPSCNLESMRQNYKTLSEFVMSKINPSATLDLPPVPTRLLPGQVVLASITPVPKEQMDLFISLERRFEQAKNDLRQLPVDTTEQRLGRIPIAMALKGVQKTIDRIGEILGKGGLLNFRDKNVLSETDRQLNETQAQINYQKFQHQPPRARRP